MKRILTLTIMCVFAFAHQNLNAQCGTSVNTGVCYTSGSLQTIAVDVCPDNPTDIVTVTFTAGTKEGCCDEIIVYSGALGSGSGGTEIYNSSAGGTTFAGIEIAGTTAGECLNIYIDADGSVDCGSGAGVPAAFDISCAGPPAPPEPGGPTCGASEPLCSGSAIIFDGTGGATDVATAEPGIDLGCLGSGPSPSWFYFEVETAGNFDLNLDPEPLASVDYDFALYGPFADVATAQGSCGAGLGAPIDCSFAAGTGSETPSVAGALAGEVYVLLVSKFGAATANFQLSEAGTTTGTTNCNIVGTPPCTDCATANCGVETTIYADEAAQGAIDPFAIGCTPPGQDVRTSPTSFERFCSEFTTPAVLTTNFVSFNGSRIESAIGCATFLGLEAYSSCGALTPVAGTTAGGGALNVYEVTPNTTYEFCFTYDAATCTSIGNTCMQVFYVDVPVCPYENESFTTQTSVCSGETIDFTEDGACVDNGGTNGIGVTPDQASDLDLYYYFDGTQYEAPMGHDPLPTTVEESFIPAGTNNLYRPTTGTNTISGCGDLSTSFVNNTCAPITVTFYVMQYNYDIDSGNGAANTYGEYTAGLCTPHRHDVVINPATLSVAVTDDGSTCGTPAVELRAADASVCETLTGAACVTDGDAFNYDFSATPTATALAGAGAGCVLPTLTGTINCAGCTPPCNASSTMTWD